MGSARGSRVFVRPDFVPWRDVPQLAAGEVWMPAVGVSGSNPVLWAGRNGTNTFSTPGATAPDAVTGPGGNPAWAFVEANSDVFTVGTPAGPLVSTGGIYVACWFRFDSLDTTNRVIVEQNGSNGSRKWHIRKTASTTTLQIEVSQDGTAIQTATVSGLTDAEGAGTVTILDKYLFLEFAFDETATTLATQTRLWLNRKPIAFTSHTGSVLTALFNGGITRYGNNNFDNQDFNGQLGPLYIGLRARGSVLPTDDHRRRIQMYLTPKDRRVQIVGRGNSIMFGQGSSSQGTTDMLSVLKASFATAGYQARDVSNRGHGGDTSKVMLDGFFTDEFLLLDKTFDRSVLVFFEVRNSFIAGVSAQQIYAEHLAYGRRAKGAGFWVLVCTAPPTDGSAVGQTVAGEANALIRAGWRDFADAFLDLELEPRFTPAGSALNALYADGVHFADAGQAIIAQLILGKIIT